MKASLFFGELQYIEVHQSQPGLGVGVNPVDGELPPNRIRAWGNVGVGFGGHGGIVPFGGGVKCRGVSFNSFNFQKVILRYSVLPVRLLLASLTLAANLQSIGT